MKRTPFTPAYFHRRVFGQLWMLALQFVLGMLLNLIGSEAPGAEHTIYITVMIVHIVNAIGLVEGGLYIALRELSRLAWVAAAAMGAAFLGGVLTVLTQRDWWSFVMACGFLVSSGLYVLLYIKADRQVNATKRS